MSGRLGRRPGCPPSTGRSDRRTPWYHLSPSSPRERAITATPGPDELDGYLPAPLRDWIEQTYYARVNAQASFDFFIRDPAFLHDPLNHLAFYSDHGVVHVRDVARQMLRVLEAINGVLIPPRPPARLKRFMKGYGVAVAYLHDVGMSDFSPFGRAMHPEFAAQAVFDPALDHLVGTLWEENSGDMAWRLLNLARSGALDGEPKLVLREMLAMSACHSKNKVPASLLNDPPRLRRLMIEAVGTDLHALYRRQAGLGGDGAERPKPPDDARRREMLRRFYADLPHEGFRWLTSTHPDLHDLVRDVIDVLRALRCADALRQRGTVLETSGQYQLFVDGATGGAVCAIHARGRSLLVSIPLALTGGEANLAGSELDRDGNLRVSFHRGAFADEDAVRRAVEYAALVVDDMQADIRESFHRAGDGATRRAERDMLILLEGVDDNPEFACGVRARLLSLNPGLEGYVVVAPSLRRAPERERTRYLEGETLRADADKRRGWLEKVARCGHRTDRIDLAEGFEHVKRVTLTRGEVLVAAGEPACFVYIPLGEGLVVLPLGGYEPHPVPAWVPVGNTGVIRGAERNATVTAERDVAVLMIPKETYLRHWHHTYSLDELIRLTAEPAPAPR